MPTASFMKKELSNHAEQKITFFAKTCNLPIDKAEKLCYNTSKITS